MEINIVKQEKDDAELELDRVTAAEVLRTYLNEQDGVEFAAWRREHPTKPAVLRIESSGSVKKEVSDAISAISRL